MALLTPKIFVPLEIVVPAILAHGMEERPYEACGVIIPDPSTAPVSWVRKMLNRADNPFSEYRLDPGMIRQLADDLGKESPVWEDVIVWHTHPSGHVGPSRGDIEYKVEGLKYLVVAVPGGEAVFF